MKTLYIECNMGVAGDMLMGALLELTENKELFIDKINSLGIPKTTVSYRPDVKCGIKGTHINVTIDGQEENNEPEHIHNNHDEAEHRQNNEPEHIHNNHDEAEHRHNNESEHSHKNHHQPEHKHSTMHSIVSIIDSMEISDKVKEDVKAIYNIIAEAEGRVHGKTVEEVHFHEVGMMDAIADITGCCMLINDIHPDRIVVSPIKTGFGHVHCAHGIMPVPAPATALILNGIPSSAGNIEGELCTPTGAAIVKYFADEFAYQPEMKTNKIGYGTGNKDFPSPNCVRVVLGEISDKEQECCKQQKKSEKQNDFGDLKDKVVELCCNLDDMTPEEIGYATEVLIKGKSLDVYTTPISMKKSRPGTLMSVLCRIEDKDEVVREIFKLTTTIGIREYQCSRYILKRSLETVDTEYGPVRIKKSEGYGVKREKPEFEDVRKAAEKTGKTLREIILDHR